MTFDELKARIAELQHMLSIFSINEVFGYAFLEMISIDWQNPENMSLHSPYRQTCYIAALAMSVKPAEKLVPLDKAAWKEICEKANGIYRYYGEMYFPKDGDFSKMSDETHHAGGVSMAAFLLNLSTGVHASVENIKDDVLGMFSLYSNEIKQEIGATVEELIDICTFIEKTLHTRLENGPIKAHECWMKYRADIGNGMDVGVAMARAQECMTIGVARSFNDVGMVSVAELEQHFPKDIVKNSLALLSQPRSAEDADIIFPTEELSVDLKPLADVGDGKFALMTGNHLILAIYENLYNCIEQLGMMEKFNKHKGKYLEEKTLEMLKLFFGSDAQYLQEVCETPDDQNEHDIIVIYGHTLLIVECKAKRIRKSFRDISKAYPRIKDDFKSYIQEGYEQARRLENIINANAETVLYKKGGEVALKLKRSRFKQIEKIVITYENEGMLATKLSLMLQREEGDRFPLCMNIQDLRQISTFKGYVKLHRAKFMRYLSGRSEVHDKIATDDELEIVGYFLEKNSFEEIVNADVGLVILNPGFSSVFDNAYRQQKHDELLRNRKAPQSAEGPVRRMKPSTRRKHSS
jgi:hypothetical protein